MPSRYRWPGPKDGAGVVVDPATQLWGKIVVAISLAVVVAALVAPYVGG